MSSAQPQRLASVRSPVVRRATEQDRPALESFYRLAFPASHHWTYPRRWQWQFADNPFRRSEVLPLWIAEADGRLVGHTGAMYVPCRVGGRTIAAAWSVDTIVLPEYRGFGLGLKLQRANQEAHDLFLSVSMSEANRHIKEKLGGRSFRPMNQWARVSRVTADGLAAEIHDALVKRTRPVIAGAAIAVFRKMLLARGMAAGLGSHFRRRRRVIQRSAARGGAFRIERLTAQFGREADTVWARARPRYDFAVERSSAYLNWKYHDQPDVRYGSAVALLDEEPVGIVVYRMGRTPEPLVGVVSELVAADEDPNVVRELVRFAADELEASGAHAVMVGSSDAGQEASLAEAGFIRYGKYEPIASGDSELVSTVSNAERAMLSFGDQDIDSFPNLQLPSLLRVVEQMVRRRF
jgi:GNAT superfamily N-acetyltransferase